MPGVIRPSEAAAAGCEMKYRIIPRFWGFEPQMRTTSGQGDAFWTPLLATGYWAEPNSYTTGRVRAKHPLGLRIARQAIQRALRINSGGLLRPSAVSGVAPLDGEQR